MSIFFHFDFITELKSAFLIFLRGIEHYVQSQLEPDIACFKTTPSPLSFRGIEHHVDLVFYPSEACELLLDIVLYTLCPVVIHILLDIDTAWRIVSELRVLLTVLMSLHTVRSFIPTW